MPMTLTVKVAVPVRGGSPENRSHCETKTMRDKHRQTEKGRVKEMDKDRQTQRKTTEKIESKRGLQKC